MIHPMTEARRQHVHGSVRPMDPTPYRTELIVCCGVSVFLVFVGLIALVLS